MKLEDIRKLIDEATPSAAEDESVHTIYRLIPKLLAVAESYEAVIRIFDRARKNPIAYSRMIPLELETGRKAIAALESES